jgi:hypothetical protein
MLEAKIENENRRRQSSESVRSSPEFQIASERRLRTWVVVVVVGMLMRVESVSDIKADD